MPTRRAILTGVRGIHRHILPTGPCCLVRKEAGELTPRRVMDALSETVVVYHPVDRQVLDGDQVKGVRNAAAALMREVAAPPRDALMHTCDHTPVLGALRCAFLLFAEAALNLGKRLFLLRKKRGLAICCPSLRVAKVFKPTSMPTWRPVAGNGVGSAHSQKKQTYHLPVLLRLMVAVLVMPSIGRCRMILTDPTPCKRRRFPSASNLQPLGAWG